MINVIRFHGVLRGRHLGRWQTKALVFLTAASVAGVMAGAGLGYGGSLVAADARAALLSAFSLAMILVACYEVVAHKVVRPLQINRETNQEWRRLGPVMSALLNGSALGAGFATRIGYWLWYVVPASAFYFASPVIGAVIFGTYAMGRTAVPVILASVLASAPSRSPHDFQDHLIRLTGTARFVAGVQLTVAASMFLVA